jgi:hypothetical protein
VAVPNKIKIARLCLLIAGGLKVATAGLFIFILAAGLAVVGWRGERPELLGNALIGVPGVFLAAAFLALGMIDIATAAGVRRRAAWARALGVFLGILMLPLFPVGTVLGLYVLTGLLGADGHAWFSAGRVLV